MRSSPALLLLCLLCCHPHGPPPSSQAATLGDPLPGAPPLEPDLRRRLRTAWDRRQRPYKPRTSHLRPDGTPRYTNRLFLESSPYLLQHAHNPVNFYPFGEEAFALARDLHRPVFLSIGYSTCHWCHVMEEESFDDEEIARYLNQNYVAIKVDREERPDLDAFYLSALQALTGSGGWPMSLWLTADRRPFYGATYLPPRDGDRGTRAGFLTILRRMRELYDTERSQVDASAAKLQEAALQGLAAAAPAGALDQAGLAKLRDQALLLYKERFDAQNGGLLGQRKFPSSLPVRLLLRAHLRTGDRQALDMATLTLERMAAGGIHDQLGGGFHRYATDPQWLVPHFEKMLYDNALLVQCYLDGYQATGRQDFAEVARRTLRYVAREMTAPDGGFYSATDADSPGPDGRRAEGLFFTFTPAEIEAVLGPQRGHRIEEFYGVTAAGNFEGRSVLHLVAPTSPAAALLADRDLLYAARKRRPPPLLDDKILASWNGLMISAMARGALVLDEPDLADRAGRAAAFILSRLRDQDQGPLARSFVAGRPQGQGFLDDQAFMLAGLLDLFQATGATPWLKEALALADVLTADFEDREHGGFFLSGSAADPVGRHKPAADGAEPSGNSVQLMNLLRLSALTSQDRFRQQAEHLLDALSGALSSSSAGVGELLLGVEFLLGRPQEIVLVTAGPLAQAGPLLAVLRQTYQPGHVLVRASREQDQSELERLLPLLRDKRPLKGQPTAYVCEGGSCQLPTTEPAVLSTLLLRR